MVENGEVGLGTCMLDIWRESGGRSRALPSDWYCKRRMQVVFVACPAELIWMAFPCKA